MADRRMRFVLEGRDELSRVMDRAGDSSDRLAARLLKLGAIGAGPAWGAAILAGTGAMVAGFAAAGAAAGAFGAAVQPQLQGITKAADAYTKAQEAQAAGGKKAAAANKAYQQELAKLPPKTRETAKAFIGLKDDYQKWSDSLADDTMPIFTKGIEAARKALPYLTPLVKTTADAVSDFMDDLDGDGLKGFVDRLNSAAKKTLPDLLNTGRNVFVGLGGIIDAFLPSSDRFTGSLEKGSEYFAKWGQGLGDSDGFKRFMDIASEGSGSLENLALAALDLYDALRPITGAWIDIAEAGAKFIRWLPPETLAAIAGGLLAIKLASLGINAAMLLLNANPVTLVMLAVLTLGAVFVTAWKKSEKFRVIATQSFAVVAQMMLGQIRVMLLGFQAFSQAGISAIVSIAEAGDSILGKIPGVGEYFHGAAEAAKKFRTDTDQVFTDALGKIDKYSDSVERMPTDIKLRGEISDLDAKIKTAQQKVDSLKQKRKTAVGADKKELDDKISAAQQKLDSLKQKRAAKISASDQASGKISWVQKMLNGISGQVATVTVVARTAGFAAANAAIAALGGIPVGRAQGGLVGFASGGPTGLVRGAGTATSDSIPAMLSNGEYVIKASAVSKYGTGLLDAINAGRYQAAAGGAGADVGRGLVAGMLGSSGAVQSAAAQMAAAVVLGVKGELQIASPSKKMQALAKDIGKGLILGLTGSRDKIRATAADLATDIRTAFSGKKESRLLAFVARETGQLQKLAAKRDAIAAKIAAAKQYASDVTKGARDFAGLSNLGLEDRVTAGSIKGGLAAKLSQIKQFSKYVDILSKRGLNRGVIRQILNMGPEAGYAYASALVGASKDTIKQINSLDNQIGSATDQLGKRGADILYDSGKNAGKGFLAGLAGQQKDIEKLMLKIAQGMQKAIKKALGIRSPSTVMARLGVYSTQGLARGLVDGLPDVDRALDTVSGRVAAARPVLGRPAVASSGGQVPAINITVNGAIDPYATARELDKVLQKYRRGRGGASYTFAT